jgi:hypothetical protein
MFQKKLKNSGFPSQFAPQHSNTHGGDTATRIHKSYNLDGLQIQSTNTNNGSQI